MADETRPCVECDGEMSPIVIMDQVGRGGLVPHSPIQVLAYRQPDDSRSFWTGKYPTAGIVQAFMCGNCGRIALYGGVPEA